MTSRKTPPVSAANITLSKRYNASTSLRKQRAHPHVELVFPDPPVNKGGPPATIENLTSLLDHYDISARYNVIKKRTEVLVPGLSGTTDNHDNDALTIVQSHAARHGIPIGAIPAIVEAIAARNLYNPVVNWITSERWDGTDRLPDICDTLTVRDEFPENLKRVLIRKWLLSAVAAALMPGGFRSRGVLTLQGPQGIGKTSWCRSLIPDESLREQVLKLDHHLDGGNKDSMIGAITHWIVEIGELDSSFKRDIARLKGFLTNDRDKVRRPYARTEAEYGRRTVFLATVNQFDFLVDHTGNSRWWTLPVVSIHFEHDIDMQQVFAQLAAELSDDAIWWLTAEEEAELERHNRQHRSFSHVEDVLSEVVDWEANATKDCHQFTATELLKRAGLDYPTNPQAKECAALLRSAFGEPTKVQGKMKFRVPLRTSDSKAELDDEDDLCRTPPARSKFD